MLAELRGARVPTEDTWVRALGVARDQLMDQRGVVTAPLIVAAFHGRLDVLSRRLRELFGSLGAEGLSAHKMLTYAPVLLDGFDPIEAVQAATHVRALLARRSASALEHTTDVMVAMLEGVNRSYSNMKMILDDQRRVTEATEPETQARLRLDMYRRIAEGQFRPWAWTLVRLNTGATGPAPTLSQLSDRLISCSDDLASAFAECLAVGLRNDAAHEDVWWDARRRILVGAAGDIDLDRLDALAERGHGLVGGAELGWALAFADMPAVAAATRKAVRTEPAMVLQVQPALTRFSTNDLKVEAWVSDLDTLTVTVKELDPRAVSSCAQAVLEMSLYLDDVERFEVCVAGHRGPVIAVTRSTLRAVLPLWTDALGRTQKMPPAVFLPVLTESRLQIEPPAVAAHAVARLALNEALHCLDALPALRVADSSAAQLLLECGLALRLVASAFLLAIELTGEDLDQVIVRAQRAVEGAAVYALAVVDEVDVDGGREALARLARLELRIRGLWERFPPVAPLPTLDLTPLV